MPTEFQWEEHKQKALEQAYSLLGEHFENVVILVADDSTRPDDDEQKEGKEILWKGGFCTALGLVTYAQHRMLADKPERKDEDE